MSEMGHNNPPEDYERLVGKVKAIWAALRDQRLSSVDTLVAIDLILRSDKNFQCYPGIDAIARSAKVRKRHTVHSSLDRLENEHGVIRRERRGQKQTNLYTIFPERLIHELQEKLDAKRAQRKSVKHTSDVPLNGISGQSDMPPKGCAAERHMPPKGCAVSGTGDMPPNGTQSIQRTIQTPNLLARARGCFKNDTLGDNATSDCYWTEDREIEVVNGYRDELKAKFPAVNITNGLAIVAGAQTDVAGKPLKFGVGLRLAINRQFARMQQDCAEKDFRAKKIYARKDEAAKPANPNITDYQRKYRQAIGRG